MKLKMHDYLLGSFLEKHNFKADAKTKCRALFKNHASYRAMLKPIQTGEDMPATVDLSFCSGWPDSSLKLMSCIEDSIQG